MTDMANTIEPLMTSLTASITPRTNYCRFGFNNWCGYDFRPNVVWCKETCVNFQKSCYKG